MLFSGPAEDRLAIRELLEAYADAVTRCDTGDWGALWAEDGVWSLPDYPEYPDTHGKAAIVAMWTEAMKAYPGIMFQAWPGSIVVEGDSAIVRSWTSEVYDQAGKVHRDRGRYEDVCVKVAGRWLFQSRSFRNIHRQQV
ncbi:nuclear transport factor 2 family protein [Sphingomonas sp. GB1N7]|uniref:nuclear transport factor 2 family protein n=1 Tax=Parasphingomonas caseinilytica TaxID=3096158 RepID=UPI002FC6E482